MTVAALLSGKRVLVTGGARGLGQAFAAGACAAGARVVVADILEDAGRATVAALRQDGHEAEFQPVDLADPAQIARAVGAAAEWLGGLDGLVNCGAIATGIGGKGFEEIDIETWDRVMTVNVLALG